MVLGAYATFLLAHQVTRDVAVAWIAGLVFGWSPIVVTRGTGHFSLIATAPLAIFLLVLPLRAPKPERHRGHLRPRDAIALGVTIAWASMTDGYYAIFCLLIGAAFVVSRVVSIDAGQASTRASSVHAHLERCDGVFGGFDSLRSQLAAAGTSRWRERS